MDGSASGEVRPGRLRGVLRGVARGGVALVSVLVLAVTGVAWSTYTRLGDIATSDVIVGATDARPAAGAPGRPATALLVGLDSRTDVQGDPLPAEIIERLHAGADDGQLNTDTIVLLRIPADPADPIVAVSTPRDSYVDIAGGRGRHKINSAYRRALEETELRLTAQGVGGTELRRRGREAGRRALVQTVQQLTGVRIDHYAEINLAGFVELTDAIGGVPVCLNAPVGDGPYSGVDLPAGPQTVQGRTALAFVRQRHGLTDGDFDRIARQQAYMAGLAHRLITAGTLSDPATMQRIVEVVTRYVVIDRGWDLDAVIAQLQRLSGDDLVFRTVPTLRPDLHTPADGIAVEIDAREVRYFVQAVLTGDALADVRTTTNPAPGTRTAAPAGHPTAPASATTTAPPTQPITAEGVPCVD
ncbi:LCP family protein [Pseudonocardia bannensis]|uniref:LCP family protein n=1 Tax=Pseudonocardia bannensis TaxID=630973 RepID=A0A848DIR8_9PSEU|nr:LCP family protein [Pseudonocardia bannensis]NMH92590.1 LCP family protein [Pseudonocardia bannensis]